jgi:excisionase family DNA binding protein
MPLPPFRLIPSQSHTPQADTMRSAQLRKDFAMPLSSYTQLPPLPTLPMGADQFQPFVSEWLTTSEVAAILHTQVNFVCQLIQQGKLVASFIGRRYLVKNTNLEAYMRSQEQ